MIFCRVLGFYDVFLGKCMILFELIFLVVILFILVMYVFIFFLCLYYFVRAMFFFT